MNGRREDGLLWPAWQVLLAEHEEGDTQSKLRRRTDYNHHTVHKNVKLLEERGLLVKEDHGRTKTLVLTTRGHVVRAALHMVMNGGGPW